MSQSNLKDFIKRSLVDIAQGVAEAAKETNKIPHNHITPNNSNTGEVKFDIAVTVSDSSASGADGSFGFDIKVVKARLGAEGEKFSGTESISRIVFSVPMAFSVSDK